MGSFIGSCLTCHCLGDKWFGQDVDSILAYQTPKIVKIQDRKLGITKNLLMLIIFVYIFIFNIYFKGEHFIESNIEGVARLQWQEPTKRCNPLDIECEANFKSLEQLPYCKSYTGGDPAALIRGCEYQDARELPVTLMGGVLIPTHINRFKQKKTCADGSKSCTRKFSYVDANGALQAGDGEAVAIEDNFIANVEDFTVLIDHSFRTQDGMIAHDDFFMRGYYKKCDKKEQNCTTTPIKCVHEFCKKYGLVDDKESGGAASLLEAADDSSQVASLRASSRRLTGASALRANDAEEEFAKGSAELELKKDIAISISDGDVFSLSTLLSMAGSSMEESWWHKKEGLENIRQRGTAIVIHIEYNNREHWVLFSPKDPPIYTISVTQRPVFMFKQAVVSNETPEGRDLAVNYGIYLEVKQTGVIARFEIVALLITFTAAMALLAASNMMTDALALYVMPNKALYNAAKYDVTEDMVDVPGSKEANAAAAEEKASQEKMS